MHQRRYIRRAVWDRLKNGIPIEGTDPVQYLVLDVGGRVYSQRVIDVERTETPLALVHVENDVVTDHNASKSIRDRLCTVNVDVVGIQRGDDSNPFKENLEDELDRLEWQVSTILCSDFPPALGLDFVHSIELVSTLPYNPDVEGEQERGFSRSVFAVRYYEELQSPGTLDEFLNFGKEISTPSGAVSEFDKTIRTS